MAAEEPFLEDIPGCYYQDTHYLLINPKQIDGIVDLESNINDFQSSSELVFSNNSHFFCPSDPHEILVKTQAMTNSSTQNFDSLDEFDSKGFDETYSHEEIKPQAIIAAELDQFQLSIPSEIAPSSEKYPVFRKYFHVPEEWKRNRLFNRLLEITYEKCEVKEIFTEIEDIFRSLGYMEDNKRMMHDYLHYFLVDILSSYGETFLTENEIANAPLIRTLLGNTTPDFLIKRNGGTILKTLIIDIYVGDKDVNEIKGKYRKLDYFSTFKVITQYNFQAELRGIVRNEDLDYLYKNWHIFLAKYYYWTASLKLKQIVFTNNTNIRPKSFNYSTDLLDSNKTDYLEKMNAFASSVIEGQDKI